MMSSALMVVLVGVYLVVAAVSAWEHNWPRVLYWVSASLLTGSVLWMQR